MKRLLYLKYLLPFLPMLFLQFITRKRRYKPEIIWDKNIWIVNIFRAWEFIFGRKHGIRAENSTTVHFENGEKIIAIEIYTIEALFAYLEAAVREFLSQKLLPFKLVTIQMVSNPNKTSGSLLPGIFFAIALDVGDNGVATGTTPLTFSHTCTGSNLFLAITPGVAAAVPTLSVPTYNAVSTTLAGTKEVNGNIIAAIYFLASPATGSNTVSMGFGGTTPSCNAVAISYTGAQASSIADATAGSAVNSRTVTVTTVAASCWVIAVLNSLNAISGPNQTIRSSSLTLSGASTGHMQAQDTNGAVAAGTAQVMSWTAGNSDTIAGASFAPAVIVAPTGYASWLTESISQPNIDIGVSIV